MARPLSLKNRRKDQGFQSAFMHLFELLTTAEIRILPHGTTKTIHQLHRSIRNTIADSTSRSPKCILEVDFNIGLLKYAISPLERLTQAFSSILPPVPHGNSRKLGCYCKCKTKTLET